MEGSKGFLEQFPFPIPWIVSAALVLGASAIVLLPSVVEMAALVRTGTHPQPTQFDTAWEALWLVALILIAGYLLEALSTPMYQLLEGYWLWPKWLHHWRRQYHIGRLDELQHQCASARAIASQTPDSPESHNVQFIEAQLAEYPVDHSDVNATRLGNVMRVMESYGMNHYGLDSQRLWYELTTVAPAPLRMELIRSRQSVDFFVATLFTSTLFAVAAILTGLFENVTGFSNQKGVLTFFMTPTGQTSVGPLYFGVAAFRIGLGTIHVLLGVSVVGLIPVFCYRMAIKCASMWAGVVRALVNLGRIQLANELNLALPNTHTEETQMWKALCNFVGHRDETKIAGWADALDAFNKNR